MIYLFLGLYVLPMLLTFVMTKAEYNNGGDWKGLLIASFVPLINCVFGFVTLFMVLDQSYNDSNIDEIRRMLKSIKLPDFKRLSPEAKAKIKFMKECRDNNIAEMKRLCEAEIKQIESDDAKQELLDKLGLSFQDLETLKALKKA